MSSILPPFEKLAVLAAKNPELLEKLRKKAIENLIDSAPEHTRARLQGLQFQIDCHRRVHKNPLATCLTISRMMHDSLRQLNDALNGTTGSAKEEPTAAKILSFPVAEAG